MARTPTRIYLQKTLKTGLRRCVYRRWEAEAKGKVLITKTMELERMYRGNTPYPIGRVRRTYLTYAGCTLAKKALQAMVARRHKQGYLSI